MTNLKIQSWNINGIRAAIKKGFWVKLEELETDILGLQEIKCDYEAMKELLGIKPEKKSSSSQNLLEESTQDTDYLDYNGFRVFWHSCSMKKGYSGTAILVRLSLIESGIVQVNSFVRELGLKEYDQEGRVTGLLMTVNEKKLFLLNCYYPQGGRDGRIPYKIGFYRAINNLSLRYKELGAELILTGDFNTTVGDIDLARPKENRKTTGCLPEERIALNWLLEDTTFDLNQLQSTNSEFQESSKTVQKLDLIDSFRYQNLELIGAYSYWDQITRARDRNVGWRIDMFFISSSLIIHLEKALIHSQMLGSDHCPIEVELSL